jgi:hypothetical protein
MLALIFLLLVQLQLAPLVHSQLLGRSNNPLFNGTVATERTTVTFTPKGASKPVEITGLRGGGFDLFQGVPFAKPREYLRVIVPVVLGSAAQRREN